MKIFIIISTLFFVSAQLLGQTDTNSDKIYGTWNYSNHYFDSEDSTNVDWPIQSMSFRDNGTFLIRSASDDLSGRFEFMDSSILLKDVSKNGVKKDGQEILHLSYLDALTFTLQVRIETGIMYVEYEKEKY